MVAFSSLITPSVVLSWMEVLSNICQSEGLHTYKPVRYVGTEDQSTAVISYPCFGESLKLLFLQCDVWAACIDGHRVLASTHV